MNVSIFCPDPEKIINGRGRRFHQLNKEETLPTFAHFLPIPTWMLVFMGAIRTQEKSKIQEVGFESLNVNICQDCMKDGPHRMGTFYEVPLRWNDTPTPEQWAPLDSVEPSLNQCHPDPDQLSIIENRIKVHVSIKNNEVIIEKDHELLFYHL